MNSLPLARIARELVVARGVAPLACVGLGRRDRGAWRFWVGGASATGPGACQTSTVFDLASVTKPIVAATAARLTQSGWFRLDEPLGTLLEPAARTPSANLPFDWFLSHRSGLDAYLPLYCVLLRKEAVSVSDLLIEAASSRRSACVGVAPADGFPPVYSDLGYLLVGAAMARVTGRDLDELVRTEVAEPLGLAIGSSRQWTRRNSGFENDRAPTETVPWRGGVLAGVVHDENAWAIGGYATAGHAGLFATADAVVRFGAAMIDAAEGRSDWLGPDYARELIKPRPGGTLRAGFDGKSHTGSAAGTRAGPSTFGHLGFTGTSLWCDPDAGQVTVLLSNRVCPTRTNTSIRTARPLVHDALAELPGGLDTWNLDT